MSSHTAHEILGVIIWVFFLAYAIIKYPANLKELVLIAIISFLFCYIGSTLPDIDNKKARAFKRMNFFIGVSVFSVSFYFLSKTANNLKTAVISVIASALITIGTILTVIFIMPRHRGPIHSLKAGAVYGLFALMVSFFIFKDYLLGAIIGFFAFLSFASHLLLDSI